MYCKHIIPPLSFLAKASTLALKRSSIKSLDLFVHTNVVTDAARSTAPAADNTNLFFIIKIFLSRDDAQDGLIQVIIIFYSPLITVIDRTVFRYINAIVGYYVYAHTKIMIISLRTKSFFGFRQP